MFLDADLIGLQKKHVINLIKPVIKNKTEMSIGVFVNGKMATDLAQKITPFLSGQRVLKRKLFDDIDCIDISKYGVEILLTKYVKDNNIKCVKVELDSVSHVTKEEKLGLIKGLNDRMKMYYDIVKSVLGLK